MRIVIQRVSHSEVKVSGQTVSRIGRGAHLLVCIEKKDTLETLKKAGDKILKLRMFSDAEDSAGAMSRSIVDIAGEIMAVSQFTLSWRGQKGNRPSFDGSMAAQEANELFERFCLYLEEAGVPIQKGIFGAKMEVVISNDGPVSFCLDF